MGYTAAARASLFGEIFTPQQALELGMVNELAPSAGAVLERAVAVAGSTPEDCLESYGFTKRACQAPALRDIADLADPLDQHDLPDAFVHEQSRHAHRRYFEQLKGRLAPW